MRKQLTHQIAIAGKVYPKGLHDFSDEVMKHPHFKHFEKAGRILTPKADSPKDKVKTAEEIAKKKEMEARYGVPRASASVQAPKIEEAKADSGFEPKVEEQPQEASVQTKKSKR